MIPSSLQVILPFLIAGLGTCFTGIIFDHVGDWEVFTKVDEIYIMLPALLGLKGNLQLTLASRFSTQYQLGNIQDLGDMLRLASANIALNQCFSNVVSLMAASLAIIIKSILIGHFLQLDHCLLMFAVCLLTSSVVSFILDLLMILILQISTDFGINPDNVASPLASSLGDMTALILLTFTADLLYSTISTSTFYIFTGFVIIAYICLIPIWVLMSLDNDHTKKILLEISYWYPLLAAVVISTIAGIIFKQTVIFSDDIALFSPIICGVSGNIAAIQSSRITTLLHKNQELGTLPPGEKVCMGPWRLFVSQSAGYNITRLLMAIIVPGQLIFYFFAVLLDGRLERVDATFTTAYLIGSFIQATTLIYLAYLLTYFLWTNLIDPDSCAIPYLTSIGDLLGACFVCAISFIAVPKTGRLK